MAEPYVQEFVLPNGRELASVVLDHEDFIKFCDELFGIAVINNDVRTGSALIERLKEAKHLPMMGRGTKTEKFFQRWGVKAKALSVIVRGHGMELAKKLLDEIQN